MIDFKTEKIEKPTFVGYIQKLKTSKMGIPRTKEGSAIMADKNIGPLKLFYDSLKIFFTLGGNISRWLENSSTMRE